MLTILTNPNPILRKLSKEIPLTQIADKKINQLYFAMIKTMVKSDGVGLSAPQIGKNIRLIVINIKDRFIVMVNPRILKKSWAKEFGQEGCLSVPGIFGKVKRNKKIACVYFDDKGKKVRLTAQGLLARVIQHEIDHLDGILFIDKVKEVV